MSRTAITNIGRSDALRVFTIILALAFAISFAMPAEAQFFKKAKDKLKGGGDESSEAAPTEASSTAAANTPMGPKKTVAVDKFEGHAGLGWDEGAVLAAQLAEALMESGRFNVVERVKLDNILQEQDLGAAGRINSQTALQIGEIVGAQVLIQGTVTEFEPGEEGKSGKVRVPIGGVSVGLGGSKVTSSVGIKLRLIDLTTSMILSTHNAEAKGSHKSMGLGVYSSYGSASGDQFKKTPLGKVAAEAIDKCVAHIITTMANIPFNARVAEVEGSSIYINAGSNRGMTEGMMLHGYKIVKTIKDPDTGLALDSIEEKTCTLKIDMVRDSISICSLVSGGKPRVGDTLKME
jgi:curli biogenesis system outer membrane secretion channel CsgG